MLVLVTLFVAASFAAKNSLSAAPPRAPGCDEFFVAITAAAANDTCFMQNATCKTCAIDRACAFCQLLHVRVYGQLFGVSYDTVCDASAVCWQGNPFAFEGSLNSFEYDGNTLNLQLVCDSLPQFAQCYVSGVVLMIIGGATILVLLGCAGLLIGLCCYCSCKKRNEAYAPLLEKGNANGKHVQHHKAATPFSGHRSGYGGTAGGAFS
jgi:hypothetical protein